MEKWAIDFIKWCDQHQIEVPRTQEELENLETFKAVGKQLTELHPNIFYLKRLFRLILDDNLLKDLPLLPPNVFTISMKKNLLIEVPQNIAKLEDLRNLALGRNMIREIPSWIGKFPALYSFECHENHIKSLEPLSQSTSLNILAVPFNEIEDLTPVYHLTNLTILDFSGNKIQAFDSRIRNLKNLEVLAGIKNKIVKFDLVFLIKRFYKMRVYLELSSGMKLNCYLLMKNILSSPFAKALAIKYYKRQQLVEE
ncbi:hypothetical protein BBW65_04220 [Helicobacter enhydrae]|uniref:Leucine-rich repeat domain-containing protein n=1 Tax=Helicobacter enhydrae TaxID=222136 RepID=A0A1B1U5T5_9HELI|nr:leucine-rich repeat domain-containing protein [Helicobacter enhydrae]ANV98055.1 hypothetical protein BBW65_04220 [Helicobacter enhydrae]